VSALAGQLAAVIRERGPMSACALASELRKRKADVLRELHAGPFVQVGRGRSTRWHALPTLPPGFAEAERAIVRQVRRGQTDGLEAIGRISDALARVAA
jgi:hypothetical protein